MPRLTEKTKQLHLDLHMGYLKQISSCSEKLDFYESVTQALLGEYSNLPQLGPMWDEINRPR
jgi:hypothetical protein